MDRFLALCVSVVFLCWATLALVAMSVFWHLDFIERYLRVSPDNGNGSSEALSVLVVCILIVALTWRIRAAKSRRTISR
jgi:hypothetical protein